MAKTTSTTPQFTANHSGLTQLTASEHQGHWITVLFPNHHVDGIWSIAQWYWYNPSQLTIIVLISGFGWWWAVSKSSIENQPWTSATSSESVFGFMLSTFYRLRLECLYMLHSLWGLKDRSGSPDHACRKQMIKMCFTLCASFCLSYFVMIMQVHIFRHDLSSTSVFYCNTQWYVYDIFSLSDRLLRFGLMIRERERESYLE